VKVSDLARLAELAFAEAERHRARAPERRAASHLWVALTVPPAKTLTAARNAIDSFGDQAAQADALALLEQLRHAVTQQPATEGTTTT
jgi:hypothetical protein